MTRRSSRAILVAALVASWPGLARAAPRFRLPSSGDGDGSVPADVTSKLAAAGWAKTDDAADVEVTLEVQAYPNRLCAKASSHWWDAGPVEHDVTCAKRYDRYGLGEYTGPSAQDIARLIVQPVVDALEEEARRRWTLRLTHLDPTQSLTVETKGGEGKDHLALAGADRTLSLASGSDANVSYGPCRLRVPSTAGEAPPIDLAALIASRSVSLAFLQDGKEIDEVSVKKGVPFELALGEPATGAPTKSIPCSGEPVLILDAPPDQYTASPTTVDPWHRWGWSVTTKSDEGRIVAHLRAANATSDSAATFEVPFEQPWWLRTGAVITGGAVGIGAVVGSLGKILDLVLKARKVRAPTKEDAKDDEDDEANKDAKDEDAKDEDAKDEGAKDGKGDAPRSEDKHDSTAKKDDGKADKEAGKPPEAEPTPAT